ncbi:cell wall hydrolase [Clostridium sp. Cult2]|uniref:cell wall hydrolase n=1 Tax=Clostridium sp. Cult2 TaxID=2079003 RepID=UPI001F221E51|nr:cell wall hydrolase [Clostridium sp. Cult2]MCF6466198.1 cell wall hydrolase [Clostridium sp. Cult2]
MKRKRITHILLVLLMLVVITTPVLANESARTLQFGHRGEDVLRLQQALNQKGYYYFYLDGIFGKITERAVINFQIDHKIRIDGIAGPETQRTLYGYPTASRGGTSIRSYNAGDIYWLARIIEAEAGGEPYKGKVAVGNVILNRVNSKNFPNTIYNVIFEYYGSIPQFSPVADGTIYNTPSQESINAAKDAINGIRPVGNSTYFFNPSKSAGSWIVKNKSYVSRIGGHVFYQ